MFNILFQNLRKIQSPPILLGRWCRTEKSLNDIKLDLANIDHCGVCILDKVNQKLIHSKTVREKKRYMLLNKEKKTYIVLNKV
jgi:hypothetical protein